MAPSASSPGRSAAAGRALTCSSSGRWRGSATPIRARGSPWDRGERLAALAGERRTLLVLDEIDSLQLPPGPGEGRLRDQALQALLTSLAGNSRGLCVLTGRFPVADLARFEGRTARRIDLEHLPTAAGVRLLRALGVRGDDTELRQAVNEFGGHALALTLLGSYLSYAEGGDIRSRREVGRLEEDLRLGGQARRVLAAFERRFKHGPEGAVLLLLGSSTGRPAARRWPPCADPPIFAAVNAGWALGEDEWRETVARLRHVELLTEQAADAPDVLDAHPLVREHFAQQLRRQLPKVWGDGHARLYEHFRRAAPELPETLEEMTPLYEAVLHGCQAGLHQRAFDEVYWPRVCRGEEFFNKRVLGTHDLDLAVLTAFFEMPWSRPVEGLREESRACVLACAGAFLWAVGRLKEAGEPMALALAASKASKDWGGAAGAPATSPNCPRSPGTWMRPGLAGEAVALAKEAGDTFWVAYNRAMLADVLLQVGELDEAKAVCPPLSALGPPTVRCHHLPYAVAAFRGLDLLLEDGQYEAAQTGAGHFLAWSGRVGAGPLASGLAHLALGQAHLAEGKRQDAPNPGVFDAARVHLEQAVAALRRAGYQDDLPRALLARAALRTTGRDWAGASADLVEAQRIARHCGMPLHLADCEIGFARLGLRMGDYSGARQRLAAATKLVQRSGYRRRDRDRHELARALPPTPPTPPPQATEVRAEAQPPEGRPSPPPATPEPAGDPESS